MSSARLHGGRDTEYYIDDGTPSGWRLLGEQAEAASPVCRLIGQASEKCRLRMPPSPGTNRDLIDRPAYTAGEHALLLADFRRRMEAIVSYAERIGAMPLLVIPPGNDAGFEPNRSFLAAMTRRTMREAFRRDFLEARRLEDGDPAAAIAAYRSLLDRQPGFAEAHYRLGLLLDKSGESERAYRHFIAARDSDGFPDPLPDRVPGRLPRDRLATRRHPDRRPGRAACDRPPRAARRPPLPGCDAPLAAGPDRHRPGDPPRAPRPPCFGWPESARRRSSTRRGAQARFRLTRESWKKICLWGVHFGAYSPWLRHDPSPRLDRKRVYAEAYDRLDAGQSIEALGLPNLGLPEPVPAVIARDPSPANRSHRP